MNGVGKITNYFCALVGEAVRPLLEWVAEQETEVSELDVDEDTWEHLPCTVPELSNQIYHLLINFTEEETYDLLTSNIGLRGNGLDAWRRMHKRWDPAVAGRSRKLLRMITSPKQAQMKNCLRAIQQWKQLLVRYERRRDESGNRRKLPEDIKLSASEALLPKELEDHLLYNKNRLKTYEESELEVMNILELKLGESVGEQGADGDVNAFDARGCFNCGDSRHFCQRLPEERQRKRQEWKRRKKVEAKEKGRGKRQEGKRRQRKRRR